MQVGIGQFALYVNGYLRPSTIYVVKRITRGKQIAAAQLADSLRCVMSEIGCARGFPAVFAES
jgi:hypothetical protein